MSLPRQVFEPGGLLERSYPGFEQRPGQVHMSEAVASAIEHSHHLIMEAPTGTGKTFAYMVPAIASGKRVVVSTGTKNLQEQLFFKDLPVLEKVLDRPISAAYMKGRDNYLCIKRFLELSAQPLFEEMSEAGYFERVSDWGKETETGDRGELDELPERFRLWDRINARADTCTGQKCSDFDKCFLTKMRRRAAEAQIVVVNHHLLMADMILKEHAFGQVIPDYSVLILDEAHALEDVATSHLGRSISARQVTELADDMERTLDDEETKGRAGTLRTAAKAFFGMVEDSGGRQSDGGRFSLDAWQTDDSWLAACIGLREALGFCESTLTSRVDEGNPDQASLPSRAVDQASTLGLIMEPRGDATRAFGPMVTWGEQRGRGITLMASPIDVSVPLRNMLFQQVPTAILTSATLAIGGSFSFVRARLGIDEAEELTLDSPFDPENQAVLYVPKSFPEPRHPDFMNQLTETVKALLAVTTGRAFLLFTSYHNLRRMRDALEGEVPYPLLAQGDASRYALLEKFRNTANSVLLATASFWHGVDVQGDALSLVAIDKLPFDVPSDPIVSARIDAIRKRGGEPFREYQVPAAVIDLKQGLGRLIRSRQDRGVLAVMDARLMTRSYGRTFIKSLPPYPLVHDIKGVRDFFSNAS